MKTAAKAGPAAWKRTIGCFHAHGFSHPDPPGNRGRSFTAYAQTGPVPQKAARPAAQNQGIEQMSKSNCHFSKADPFTLSLLLKQDLVGR
jgi:hypothetical protein